MYDSENVSFYKKCKIKNNYKDMEMHNQDA